MKKQFLYIVFGVFTALLLCSSVGCSLRPHRSADEPFRLGFPETADNFNPYGADSAGEAVALSLLYDTLFELDPVTGEYGPGLCVNHSVSENADGSYSWDLEIQSGVYWHDGQPLTAEDVMFTLKTTQLFSRLYGSPNCDFFYGGNMTVIDDRHLSFVIWDDYAYMEAYLSQVPILPEHIWNAFPYMQYTEAGQASDHALAHRELPLVEANAATMIGSGPWRWGGYRDGVCRLYRNENCWSGAPVLESVELVFGASEPLEKLMNGELHGCWDMSAVDMKAASEAGFLTGSGSTGDMLSLHFNLHTSSGSPTNDLVLRQAVDAVLNRQEILSLAFGGGLANSSLLPEDSHWYNAAGEIALDYDPMSLLDRQGYVDQNGDGFRESMTGETMNLTLICPDDSPRWTAAAACIQEQCASIGLSVSVESLGADERNRRMAAGEYDMLLTGWHLGADPAFLLGAFYWKDGYNAYCTVNPHGELEFPGWNDSGYCNNAYDSLFEQFVVEKDIVQRKILAEQLVAIVRSDRPVLVLGWPLRYQAAASPWKEFHGDGGVLFTGESLREVLSSVELK